MDNLKGYFYWNLHLTHLKTIDVEQDSGQSNEIFPLIEKLKEAIVQQENQSDSSNDNQVNSNNDLLKTMKLLMPKGRV